MIREGHEFSEYVRVELFLQRVYDLCDSLKLRNLYKVGTALTSDVAFAHDTFWRMSDAKVSKIFKELVVPRVLITEVLHGRDLMTYTEIAARHRYQLIRCRFIPSDNGDIACLEFLREADNDQISEDRAGHRR